MEARQPSAFDPAPHDSRSLPAVPLIAGLGFAIAGILMTLDNFDLIESEGVLAWWPVALIAIGIARFFERDGSRLVGVVFLLAGTALLADNLNLIRVSPFDLWPLILILVGAGFVARALGFNPVDRYAGATRDGNLAVLSERRIEETSRDYRGGHAAAFLGTLKLDLSRADIVSGPAVLHAHAFWGSVEILVPENWEVVGEVAPFMAAFEVKTRGIADPKRRLIVRGGAMMAGIEVKTVSRREA